MSQARRAWGLALLLGVGLGASGCAYAEATRTQSLPDWLASHVRALEYYGAAPTIFVPDNPLNGLTQPQINKLAYADCTTGGMMGPA